MACDFIEPFCDALLTVLEAVTVPGLPSFGRVELGSAVTLMQPPEAEVIPSRTVFTDEGSVNGSRPQAHYVTVRLGLVGSEPGQLTRDVIAYVRAVDLAISEYDGWPDARLQVFVVSHDYGVMFKGDGGVAYFPELQVQISAEELIGE